MGERSKRGMSHSRTEAATDSGKTQQDLADLRRSERLRDRMGERSKRGISPSWMEAATDSDKTQQDLADLPRSKRQRDRMGERSKRGISPSWMEAATDSDKTQQDLADLPRSKRQRDRMGERSKRGISHSWTEAATDSRKNQQDLADLRRSEMLRDRMGERSKRGMSHSWTEAATDSGKTQQDLADLRRSERLRRSPDPQIKIGHLPPEIFRKIFSYLGVRDKVSAAQVCSGWRDVVYAPELWKNIPAKLNLDSMTSLDFDSLRIRKMRQAAVTCRELGKMKDFMASVSSSLENLDVTRLHMTREKISEIFQMDFPCLREVYLRVSCVRSGVLELFSMHLHNLTSLYLETRVSSETISALNGLKKLRHLRLKSQRYLTLPVPAQLPTQSSCIEEINFAGMNVNDSGLSYIRQVHGKLKRLEIKLAPNVSVFGIQRLADMPALESLQLASNKPVDGWMECLSRGLSQLTSLDLGRCPHLGKIEFLARLPGLERLTMKVNCDTDSWKCLTQCVKLKLLVLSLDTSMIIDVQSLTKLGHLEFLLLSNCSMQDADLQTLCQSLPFLKTLSLRCLPLITDEVMGAVGQMPCLESLLLHDCNVGDEGMRCLSAGAAPLCNLLLDGLRITDQGLKKLSEGLRHARTVGIYKCPISESGLGFVVKNLPCLKTLQASISTRAMQRLRLMRPGLIIES